MAEVNKKHMWSAHHDIVIIILDIKESYIETPFHLRFLHEI